MGKSKNKARKNRNINKPQSRNQQRRATYKAQAGIKKKP